ncbi:uncharacterized protein isoform X1 [Rhodnius prolixus]|uniref:uncharacterized protein isoform X1 n=1 Tax=Rhodnius prolixus TaxID=13249 RepID=UPI003D18C445
MNSPRIRLDLTAHKKEETPPVLYRQKLLEILNFYMDYRPIYTDGSKICNGVGCAIYTQGVTATWTLPSHATVYTAEMYAIWQALKTISERNYSKVLVLTDSLSAIKALQDRFSDDPFIIRIHETLHNLNTCDKKVIFVWVPGHIGVAGNERADAAAKQAACSNADLAIPVRPDDVKTFAKYSMFKKWQSEWDLLNEKLKQIKPQVLNQIVENFPRRESVVLTRLRIGHTRVTHGYLLVNGRKPKCPLCRESLTVIHMLEECQALKGKRQRTGLPCNLRAILKEGSPYIGKLFDFLKSSNLYSKI